MRGEELTRADGGANCLRISSIEPIRLGMPELCRVGLSENWLFKACGHRHWLALAQCFGLENPDFRTAEGERLYPAFTSVRLADGKLDRVAEGDVLHFAVTLHRTGRTSFCSSIIVTSGNLVVAAMTMETAFVRRAVAGSNRSVCRDLVARPCALLPPVSESRLRKPSMAIFPPSDRIMATAMIDPSPHEDFNGAEFLYFAAYQAMADRAEWRWWHHTPPLSTRRREITYLGNIELGERVRLTLRSLARRPHGLDHRIEIVGGADERLIAVVTSERYVAPLA